MSSSSERVNISKFVRVLAWIFVACGVLALVLMGHEIFVLHRSVQDGGELLMLFLGMGVLLPLFSFVAWTGRSPRWMRSFETRVEDAAKVRGMFWRSHMRASRARLDEHRSPSDDPPP